MSDYICGVQTRGVRYIDPEPAEYCMTEVENEDDLCARHDEDDRADDLYENYLESLRQE